MLHYDVLICIINIQYLVYKVLFKKNTTSDQYKVLLKKNTISDQYNRKLQTDQNVIIDQQYGVHTFLYNL